jgi:hypothetical protein
VKTKLAATLAIAAGVLTPVWAHHSFAAYDMKVTKTMTGVVTRVNPDANHLQIFFAPMNEERKNVERGPDGRPILWAVEMTGSAQAAQSGISVSSFPPGAIFTVTLHPARNGEHAGTRGQDGGPIFKCPDKKPPAAGKHCDTVAGSTRYGGVLGNNPTPPTPVSVPAPATKE